MNQNMSYGQYLDIWIDGLTSEIRFWKSYMENRGGSYFVDFQETVARDKRFMLEDDIPKNAYGLKYDFIDIGSGPFSRCGSLTDKVDLHIMCVDPLAGCYDILKKRYGLQNGISLRMGFVETLDVLFPPNCFDMVHMSNSLDHSFDAVHGIYQMFRICKIGGKIILRHAENEAELAGYSGLHQWNLSLKNPEGEFTVWNKDGKVNICELLKGYANLAFFPDEIEESSGWCYNKVVITKLREAPITSTCYAEELFQKIYGVFLDGLLQEVDLEVPKTSEQERIVARIRDIFFSPNSFAGKLREQGISSVVVYGMGSVGQALCHLLDRCGIVIKDTLDKRYEKFGDVGREIHSPENYIWDGESFVVVTVLLEKMDVIKQLDEKIKNRLKIIHILDFLDGT